MIINFELNIKIDKTKYTKIIKKDVSSNLRNFCYDFCLDILSQKSNEIIESIELNILGLNLSFVIYSDFSCEYLVNGEKVDNKSLIRIFNINAVKTFYKFKQDGFENAIKNILKYLHKNSLSFPSDSNIAQIYKDVNYANDTIEYKISLINNLLINSIYHTIRLDSDDYKVIKSRNLIKIKTIDKKSYDMILDLDKIYKDLTYKLYLYREKFDLT